ncbi:MAG: hypothetical protein ACFFC3_13580 [Candidatus Odinarchaeota archaeon]
MKNKKHKLYSVIIVNADKCTYCESCMSICSFVHGTKYIPLERRIIGKRIRNEIEWGIKCDLCIGMKEEFVDFKIGKTPQCESVCSSNAISFGSIKAQKNETRLEALKRVFS